MKFSVVLFKNEDCPGIVQVTLGHYGTPKEIQKLIDDGGGTDGVIRFEQFDCGNSPNAGVFHAIATSDLVYGIGGDLERFAQFCFDLGWKMGEKK